jgi:protoporphyrinogen oxidase
MKNYDIIIIGGGISGIYSMYNLKKKYPKLKVLLLEKDERFGGRVYSFNKKVDNIDYIMDLGAGRIGHHHKLMVSLIKELKLEKFMFNISNTENYIEYNKKNREVSDQSLLRKKYSTILYNFFNSSKIANLSKTFLIKFYFNELLMKFFPKSIYKFIENSFEYKNKLYYLNAYNAINYFKYDYNDKSQFFIMTNGLSSIIETMISKISLNKNYKLKKNSCVNNIIYNNETSKYNIYYKQNNNTYNISCKHLICALPRSNLIKFKILNPYLRELNSINEISKVRIFEIYDKSINEEMWFKNVKKTTTNNELQFIIPINPETGLIMSSYNENLSNRENYWNNLYKKGTNVLKNKLHEKLNQLFSIYNIVIPESKYIKFYYWKSGVACWKKNVDSYYVSQKILNLMPNFYICGENYSNYQAWCEGALESSESVLNKLKCELIKTNFNKTRKLKK